jgi:two-component system, NtrC family, response regulator HydG
MAELVFLRHGEEVLRFALDRSRVVLGRGEKSDVVIPDPDVGRQQMALLLDGGNAVVEDLSGNGTVVSGAKTLRAPLPDGADIALGQWRAVFHQQVSRPAAPPLTAEVVTASQRWPPAQVRVRCASGEWVHRITGDTLRVGSDAGNDLVLADPQVSGCHLRLVRQSGGFLAVDPGNTSGSFVGSVRVFKAELPMNATLRCGETELSLELATPEATLEGFIGADPSIRQLVELIERVADSSATVCVSGECGTGKELVARTLHARSHRAHRPFVAVDCAAMSHELFGTGPDAFPRTDSAFEEARGGTLFVDDIGELPAELQAKLLWALELGDARETGAPLVRVVAGSSGDLLSATHAGTFREDLYYRLCVIPLHLPPLRGRRGDVPLLAEHFLKLFSPRGQTVRMSAEALERLRLHPWPGNIRELRNVVHRALLLRRGPTIEVADLSFDAVAEAESRLPSNEFIPGQTLEQMLHRLERQIVESALVRFNQNRERVARELGVARSTLFKRLKEWGLTRREMPEPGGRAPLE